jgi:uncharacterized protein (TIGR03435 family)
MRRAMVCAAIGVRILLGQAANSLSFDVAVVKVNQTESGHTSAHSGPGGLEMSNVTLRFCITRAWRITDPQVSGPAWIDSDRYDIVAKAPAGAPEAQIPEMLQALLAERFKLVAHRERKELPAFALVVGKNGPKLTKAELNESGGGMTSGDGTVSGQAVTMARLASFLATPRLDLGLPVVDQTGLEGTFSFTLKWTPEKLLTGKAAGKAPDLDGPPSIFTALNEQLGLKLEKRKALLEVLIVDKAERVPTEN